MKISNIISYLNKYINESPIICVQLGSGLSSFKNKLRNKVEIPYKNIPNFLTTSVSGHEGNFIYGYLNGVPILCANGRFHYYEGYTFEQVGSIIQIFKKYRPKLSIITNSSGCLNLKWNLGEFMIINQFLDFSFINSINTKYFNITKSKDYYNILKVAKKQNIILHEGTYTYTTGPAYETKAEIQEIIDLNGHAVGMSTFPEFLMCKKNKLNSVFIACLTNYGAGLIDNQKINHKDVLRGAKESKSNFEELIINIIENIEPQKKQKK